MKTTQPKREGGASDSIRLPLTLLNRARTAGDIASRTIPKQVEHWAIIGQLVTESPAFRALDIKELLEGKRTFDDLTSGEKFTILADAGAFFDSLDGDKEFAKELARRGKPLASGSGGRVTWTKPTPAAGIAVKSIHGVVRSSDMESRITTHVVLSGTVKNAGTVRKAALTPTGGLKMAVKKAAAKKAVVKKEAVKKKR